MDIQQKEFQSFPLFRDITAENIPVMLNCLGYRIEKYKKGVFISLEGEHLQNIGIILDGSVDMIKEDYWGNKTILIRMHSPSIFGETFICGTKAIATVSFLASSDAVILFCRFSV